jgi:hypothetical protein
VYVGVGTCKFDCDLYGLLFGGRLLRGARRWLLLLLKINLFVKLILFHSASAFPSDGYLAK